MSDPVFQLLQHYIVAQHLDTFIRPYEFKGSLTQDVELDGFLEKLPEDGHWRASLRLACHGISPEQPAFDAACSVEAIVLATGLPDEEVQALLTHSVTPTLFASCRNQLSALTSQSGYGPVVIPPIDAARIAAKVRVLQKG